MPWGEPLSARARLEESMIDTCRILAGVDVGDYNEATGAITYGAGEVLYEGPCMITTRDTVSRDRLRGGEQEHVARYQNSVPYDAGTFTPGNVVVMLTCVADPDLVDRKLMVVAVAYGTGVARRRLLCDLIQPGVRR